MQNKIYLALLSKTIKIGNIKSDCSDIDTFPYALFSILWNHIPTSVHQADESMIPCNCSYNVA